MRATVIVQDQDILDFSWRGLRNFNNVEFCKKKIIELHGLPIKHYKNAEKQAMQIRYCLMQAKEYFDASRVVSLGTKPLLLYYCCLSLALAQVLFRGTGLDSLENARGKNAHHGLALKIDGDLSGVRAYDFRPIESLRSAPVVINGERIGTFELWQRLSFELPLVGKETDSRSGSPVVSLGSVLMKSDGSRQWVMPQGGLSLFEVFCNCPGMLDWFAHQGLQSQIVRGKMELTRAVDSAILHLVLHPAEAKSIEKLACGFKFQPSVVPDLFIKEYASGFAINVDVAKISGRFEYPQGYMWRTDEIRFPDPDFKLNIFGLYYVGLHILGNLARYYPEVWMRHIDAHTPLASGSEVFVELAAVEVALTTLSVMSDYLYVPVMR